MNKFLKSYDVNSMTSKTFESFNDKDCSLWLLFYLCKISRTNFHYN